MVSEKSRETILVERAIKKDKKALAELCNIKGKQVLFTCVKILGNYHDAEDAAQEVILKMYKNIKKLKSPEAFNSWLHRLTTNACADIGRKSMKYKDYVNIEDVLEDLSQYEGLDTIPPEYVETEENRQRVMECIDRLPIPYARSIRMFYYDGMSYTEISEALGVTADAVRMYMYKGRKQLKEELAGTFKDTKLNSVTPALALGPVVRELTARSIEMTISDEMLQGLLKKAGVLGFLGLGKTLAEITTILSSLTLTVASIFIIGYGIKEVSVPPPPEFPAASPSANGVPDADLPQGLPDGTSLVDEDEKDNSESEVLAHTISGRIYLQRSSATDPNARNGLAGIQIELIDAETGKAVEATETLSGIENGLFRLHTAKAGSFKVCISLPESATLAAGSEMLEKDKEQENTYWLLNGGKDMYEFTDEEIFLLNDIEIELQMVSTISGEISLLSNTGGILPNIGSYLPNITVNLIDPQDRIVDTTHVSPDGSFSFHNPMVAQSGQYKVQYSLGNFHGISQQTAEQTCTLLPGHSIALGRVAIADQTPPAINLDLSDGDCDCGHINPGEAQIRIFDTTGFTMRWEFESQDSSAVFTRGTTTFELNSALHALANGSYTLTIVAEDAAGNSSSYSQEILIKR